MKFQWIGMEPSTEIMTLHSRIGVPIEESMLLIVSDYVNLVRKLIKVSTENGVKKEIIDQLLDEKTANPSFFPRIQKYSDLLAGRFQIDELIRINRDE